ncbi:unnamed protein product [Enterobius vermicularis]|uniref:DUF4102 domain-containing protein n=1 Tax=Enterobius vermicularis TaxID=51028 RepID=A0A0N4V8Y1_ENTVE|nr:unnamed protein product [Enterobius vermicularis]
MYDYILAKHSVRCIRKTPCQYATVWIVDLKNSGFAVSYKDNGENPRGESLKQMISLQELISQEEGCSQITRRM